MGWDNTELKAKNCLILAKNLDFALCLVFFGPLPCRPLANFAEVFMGHWGMLWLCVIQILLGSDMIRAGNSWSWVGSFSFFIPCLSNGMASQAWLHCPAAQQQQLAVGWGWTVIHDREWPALTVTLKCSFPCELTSSAVAKCNRGTSLGRSTTGRDETTARRSCCYLGPWPSTFAPPACFYLGNFVHSGPQPIFKMILLSCVGLSQTKKDDVVVACPMSTVTNLRWVDAYRSKSEPLNMWFTNHESLGSGSLTTTKEIRPPEPHWKKWVFMFRIQWVWVARPLICMQFNRFAVVRAGDRGGGASAAQLARGRGRLASCKLQLLCTVSLRTARGLRRSKFEKCVKTNHASY